MEEKGTWQLEALVKPENPFTNDVLLDWRKQLDDFNAGAEECPLPNFRINADEEWVAEYQSKYEEKGMGLHFELLPDPFRGDPRAPVWILLLNPGYSEVDRYDHLGLCPICGKRLVRVDGKTTSHVNGCVTRFFGSRLPDASAALKSRQDMLLEELKLNFSKPRQFLWFDPNFNTVPEENATAAGKGGRLWWKGFLFGSCDERSENYVLPKCKIVKSTPNLNYELGRRIFALELFPYHSSRFDSGFVYKNTYRDSQYFRLWYHLVNWAVQTEKILIVRYAAVRDALKDAVGCSLYESYREKILNMASIQPSLTYNNIYGRGEKKKNGKSAVANLEVALTNPFEC